MIKGICKVCKREFGGNDRNIIEKLFSAHVDKHHKAKLQNQGVVMRMKEETDEDI